MTKFKLFHSLNQNKIEFLCLAALTMAMVPLLLTGHYFCSDWLNHLWPVGYISNYFRSHLWIPDVVSTNNFIGLPYHVFYGRWLYIFGGLLGALFQPEVGLRLVLFFSFFFQAASVFLAFRSLGHQRDTSAFATVVVSISTYSLTNLYHRAALPEYVATASIITTIALTVLLANTRQTPHKIFYFFSLVLALVWATGNHPITTLYFGLVASLLFLVLQIFAPSLIKNNFRILLILSFAGAIAFAINFSSYYAIIRYKSDLHISTTSILNFIESVDTIVTRLFPIPFDKRSLINGTKIDTPYLETQINGALLLLVLLGIRTKTLKPFKFACLGLAGIFLWLSVSNTGWNFIPSSLTIVQFPYRLVTYVNLFLFLALLGTNLEKHRRTIAPLMVYILIGLIIKLVHVGAVKTDKSKVGVGNDKSYLTWINDTGPLKNYTTTGPWSQIDNADLKTAKTTNLTITVNSPHFGEVPSALAAESGWHLTNVSAFPWNHIYVNGERAKDLLRNDGRIAVHISQSKSRLDLAVTPDKTWYRLNIISYLFLIAALTGFVGSFILLLRSMLRTKGLWA
ncbi:MAG TPA: hypothetical protein PLH57_01460 [Oligoflexia bacterium]|mgnify:CR=1 FL=1|nr:hypothetical protein [Oligoflexia bacterium]